MGEFIQNPDGSVTRIGGNGGNSGNGSNGGNGGNGKPSGDNSFLWIILLIIVIVAVIIIAPIILSNNSRYDYPEVTIDSAVALVDSAAVLVEDEDEDLVEQLPTFPGGDVALMEFLSTHIQYPITAAENGIEGNVVVGFDVDETGNVGDVKVIHSVDPSLDAEAIRVCRTLPDFEPGRRNGVPVATTYTLPVSFKLSNGMSDNITNGFTRYESSHWSVEYPLGWNVVENPDANTDAYFGPSNQRGGFTVICVPTSDDLVAIVGDMHNGFIQMGATCTYDVMKTINGNSCYNAVISWKVGSVPAKQGMFVFKKYGRMYALSFGTDPNWVNNNIPLIDNIVESFRMY